MALEDARCAEKVDEPIESSQHNDFNFKEPKVDETKRRDDMWREMLNFFKTWFFGISPHQLMLRYDALCRNPSPAYLKSSHCPRQRFWSPMRRRPMGSVDGVKKWVEWHLKILTDSTCPFQGYLLLLYIIPITSISEYLTFSAISMHFNNPTVNSQALPEELLDDPPGYRLEKLIKNCARKKQLQVHFNDWILVQLEILGQMLFVFFAFHPTIARKNCLAVGLTWLMRTLASGASVPSFGDCMEPWGIFYGHT